MFITFRKQDAHTKQPSQSYTYPRRLDKFVVPLHQHLTQRLRIRHQDPWLIEQPAIIQHTIIRHIIDPISLWLTSRILKDPPEMT
jgi:hypothetical protein